MRKALLGSFSALLAGAGLALAEAPPSATVLPAKPPLAVTPDMQPAATIDGDCGAGPHLWLNAEYLLWWVKDAPLPAALVTTGDPNTDNPGALGHGGVPVYGDQADLGTFSGVRVTAGAWLDADQTLGFEASGFILPRRTKTFQASSDANGNPVIAFRYLDPPGANGVAAEDAFQASVPAGNPFGVGPFAGGVAVVSRSRLWGAEANAVGNLGSSGSVRVQVLGGFRYLDLDESLDLLWRSQALAGATVPFQGVFFPSPSSVSSTDSFHTRTQFYGGQIGVRGEFGFGQAFVSLSGKVGLGDSHEVVQVTGSSSVSPAGGTPMSVGVGQFAAPSNIGRFTRDEFAVVPEVEVKVGYAVTDNLRAFVGYDFLYWSRVVRPGNQVDLVVDTRQDPVNPGFVPTNPKTTFPQSEFNHSDFWAQGVTFGLEFRY